MRIAGGNIVFQAEKSLSFTWTAPDSLGEYTIDAAVKSNDDIDTHCHGKEDIANFDVVRNSYWPTVVQNSLNPETLYFLLEKDHSDEPKTQIFRARGSDRDGNLSKAEWTVNDNLRKVVNYDPSRSSEDTVFSFPFNQPGEYEVSVVFEDTKGRRSYASNAKWTVTVGSPPTPTVDSLECSPTPATLGEETECSATFRDAQPTRIHWTAVDGTPGAYSPIGNKEFKTKWTSIGQRTNVLREISVYGCNDNGCGATWSRSVRVVNYAPRASTDSISPEPSSSNLLKANQRYTFTARATDSDNNLVSYQWHIDGSPVTPQPVAFREADSKTESFSRSFQAGATHMVEATFTDSNGNSDSVKWSFTVNNPPTVTLARSEAQSSPIHVDTPEAFSIEGEDIDGNLEKWSWEVDRVGVPWDGHASPELGEPFSTTFSHSFPSSGFYDVTATLTDAEEASDSATLRVEVEDAPEPPDLAIEIAEQVTPVLGKNLSLPVLLENRGGSPSGPLNLSVSFTALSKDLDEVTTIHAERSAAHSSAEETGVLGGLNAGSTFVWPESVVLPSVMPGPHLLCVEIAYVNQVADSDMSNNADCAPVYVLPDMGDTFPGELQAFFHLDDEFQHDLDIDIDLEEIKTGSILSALLGLGPAPGAIGTVIGSSIEASSFDYGSQSFWVFVPTGYTGGESEELAEEIVERTLGGLEHRENRKGRYKKLALEIARRGQTYGNNFYSVGDTEKEKQEFLDTVAKVNETTGDFVEVGGTVIDVGEFLHGLSEVAGVDIDLSDIGIFHGHLNHLTADRVGGFLTGISIGSKTAGLVNDIRITESLNRTIHYKEAKETLRVLEELGLEDAAWQEAIEEAMAELNDMTSPDGYRRWSSALEKNLPKIVGVYADLALKYAVKKAAVALAGKAVASIGILAGVPVTVVAIPLTIVAVFTIEELYELADETDKFWDGITLAGMSTQLYSHIHARLNHSRITYADQPAMEEIRDYLKFAYYKHLARAAEADPEFASIDVGIWGDGKITHDILTSEREAIFHERDEILSEAFGGDWDHTKDFKFLDDADRPSDIWSDGETMWVVTEQTPHFHLVYRFSLKQPTHLKDSRLTLRRYANSSFQSARGIWLDESHIWILDPLGVDILRKYSISSPSRRPITEIFLSPQTQDFFDLAGGIWSDGTTMWFTSGTTRQSTIKGDCAILAYNIIDSIRDEDKDICYLAEENQNPYGLWSDGKTMWVSDIEEGRVFAYSVRFENRVAGDPEPREREIGKEFVTVKVVDVSEENYPHIANNSTPTGIWSDGETMWVADRESDRIFAYTLPDSLSEPLNLTATVSGDSRIDLLWQVPSDTGRTAITGYVVQESEDGQTWNNLADDTGSASTSYSRTGLSDWGIRHYRVAAINRAGIGLLSGIATAHQGFSIDRIACSPDRFYFGERVQCSAVIGAEIIPEYDYAWQTDDGTPIVVASVEDGSGGSTSTVVWDSAGQKRLRVVACRSGDASDYAYSTVPIVGLIGTTADVASGGACTEATQTIHVAEPTPRLVPRTRLPDDTIALGESMTLEFRIAKPSWVGGPGGITVSFPGLAAANSGDRSAPYESDQGKVTTISYSGNNSQINYYDSGGTETVEDTDGNGVQPGYLIVATDNDQWPSPVVPPERTLKLRVAPKEPGAFRILYRYWLCNEERLDSEGHPICNRYPQQDDADFLGRDQQGWAVREFTITVVAPPVIESLGCSPDTVDVGVAVACTPVLRGGSADLYTWNAGYGVVGGNPSSGADGTFSTIWGFSGQQTVSLEVCNDISGCVSAEQIIAVNPDPTSPEPGKEIIPTIVEPEPGDGGRVLIAGPTSDWAHSDYSPTDSTIQVRVVPSPDMPTLEIIIYDEDGFTGGAGPYVSPGAIVLALPEDVWVEYGQIATEMHIAGSWVDYTDELEQSLLALESAAGEVRRTAATVLGLSPAASGAALTASNRLAWGLGETGGIPVNDIFQARYANCVAHVAVAWLAWAADTTGVRISVPVDLSAEDYVSLAAAFITAEPEADGGRGPTLVQAHDLLDTGDDAPGCQQPWP